MTALPSFEGTLPELLAWLAGQGAEQVELIGGHHRLGARYAATPTRWDARLLELGGENLDGSTPGETQHCGSARLP